MIGRYQRLADRMRNELAELEREVKRAQKSWQAAQVAPDPSAYIDSVALNLHGFYSGVERLLELVAEQVDERSMGGEAWHRDLIDQMKRDVPDIRPAVIKLETANNLDELRKFRHLVRNVYTAHLDPARMTNLLDALPHVWTQLKADFLVFAEFLDFLSRADEGDSTN